METIITKEDFLQQIRTEVFADLRTDFMFKKIFGSEENKDILMAFLNSVIPGSDIKDVTHIKTENLGERQDDNRTYYDIACRNSRGETFIVEMQLAKRRHFVERTIYYTCYPLLMQGRESRERYERIKMEIQEENRERLRLAKESGKSPEEVPLRKVSPYKWDYNLKPVIIVSILNFSLDHGEGWPKEKCHSSYSLREDTNSSLLSNVVRYVYLELGRFNKKESELQSLTDKWFYAFKNMRFLREQPSVMTEHEFNRLFNLSKIYKFADNEVESYTDELMTREDIQDFIECAQEDGMKKGIEIGRAEGRAEVKRETAARLLKMGLTPEQVAEGTGLDIEIVKSL